LPLLVEGPAEKDRPDPSDDERGEEQLEQAVDHDERVVAALRHNLALLVQPDLPDAGER